jgi:hypothetical protein
MNEQIPDIEDLYKTARFKSYPVLFENAIENNQRDGDCDSLDESDVTNEPNTNLKIDKINKKLSKSRSINKVEKRRLQNRKSALRCRLKKVNMIRELSDQVEDLKRQNELLLMKVSFIFTLLMTDG